jgi:ParB family chromosome partitioning protein
MQSPSDFSPFLKELHMNVTKAETNAIEQTHSTVLAEMQAVATLQQVPLKSLVRSDAYQARKTRAAAGAQSIKELAETIISIGRLLQNLVGVARGDGIVEVCAGGRRLEALNLLMEQGRLPDGYLVPVLIIPAEHAHHASLLENHARVDMHPADVFDAYHRLKQDGMGIESIAAAHGATVAAVRKLLALGDVAPSLMEMYRENQASLEDMQALASVADHARQLAAWEASQHAHWNRASTIRSFLAENDMRGNCAAARYVTVAAYEKAGGTVRRDLFASDDASVFLESPELVTSLAVQKMQRSKRAKELNAEGWAWIEFAVSLEYDEKRAFGEIQRTRRAPTDAEAKAIAELEGQKATIEAQIESLEENGEQHDALPRLHQEHEQVEETISDARAALVDFDPKLKSLAGCIVHLDYYGSLTATKGLVRMADRQALVDALGADEQQFTEGTTLPPVKTRPVHSQALVDSLHAQYAMAMQAELVQRPNLALCLWIAQCLRDSEWVGDAWKATRWFDARASSAHGDLFRSDERLKESRAWEVMQKLTDDWKKRLPKSTDQLVPYLLTVPQDELVELLALLMSRTVYRTEQHSTGIKHLHSLQTQMGVDLSAWWKPTAQSYFARVSKDHMMEVVTSQASAEAAAPLAKMKKAEAAAAAEKALEGINWLPTPIAPVAGQGADEDDQDLDEDDEEDLGE